MILGFGLWKQFAGSDAKGLSQFGDVDQADVALAPFDASDVVSVQPGLETQRLLGPAPFFAQLAYTGANQAFDVSRLHGLTSHV